MESGSEAKTVKILRLSPKRPLCAMQSKLSHGGLSRLPQNKQTGGLETVAVRGLGLRGSAKCYSLLE
jgi:hypothetical protein